MSSSLRIGRGHALRKRLPSGESDISQSTQDYPARARKTPSVETFNDADSFITEDHHATRPHHSTTVEDDAWEKDFLFDITKQQSHDSASGLGGSAGMGSDDDSSRPPANDSARTDSPASRDHEPTQGIYPDPAAGTFRDNSANDEQISDQEKTSKATAPESESGDPGFYFTKTLSRMFTTGSGIPSTAAGGGGGGGISGTLASGLFHGLTRGLSGLFGTGGAGGFDGEDGNDWNDFDHDQNSDSENEEGDWDLEMYPMGVDEDGECGNDRPSHNVSAGFKRVSSGDQPTKRRRFTELKYESMLEFLEDEPPRGKSEPPPTECDLQPPVLFSEALHRSWAGQGLPNGTMPEVPQVPTSTHGFISWLESLAAAVQTGDMEVGTSPPLPNGKQGLPPHWSDHDLAAAIRTCEWLHAEQRHVECIELFRRVIPVLKELPVRLSEVVDTNDREQPTSRRSLSPRNGTDAYVMGLASSVLILLGQLGEHDPSQIQVSDIELAVGAVEALAESMSTSHPRISLQLRLYEVFAHLMLLGGDGWSAALPVSMEKCFLGVLDECRGHLRDSICAQDVEDFQQLEALAIANLDLFRLGYSPLTTASLRGAHSDRCKRSNGEPVQDPEADHELALIIPFLPPDSLPRAKAALAMGLALLNGVMHDGSGFAEQSDTVLRGHSLALAESLFFESACVGVSLQIGQQHMEANRWVCRQNSAGAHFSLMHRPVFVSAYGSTVLQGFATCLALRGKHTFAMPVLEVCANVTRMRGRVEDERLLRRELCVMCAQCGKAPQAIILLKQLRPSIFSTRDINEILLTTNMLLTLCLDSGDQAGAHGALQEAILALEVNLGSLCHLLLPYSPCGD